MNLLKRLQWARTPQKEKQQLMDTLMKVLEELPETRALLAQAREDGVDIRFTAALTGTATSAAYYPRELEVEVDPFAEPMELVLSLAHELRHHWQYKKLGMPPQTDDYLYKTPRLAFIFGRVVEADAFAFEKKIENALILMSLDRAIAAAGKSPPPGDTKENIRRSCKERFIETLQDISFSDHYDLSDVRVIYNVAADRVDSDSELTIADVRSLLKAGVTKNAPGYLDELSDRQFEALVLRHANPQAYQAVKLMEKFNAAVAANDNQAAKTLQRQLKQKIRHLPK